MAAEYVVCVDYKNNARLLDDSASGKYERCFGSKREAWNYVKAVGRHADAKPYMTVYVIVVVNGQHVWANIWNAR